MLQSCYRLVVEISYLQPFSVLGWFRFAVGLPVRVRRYSLPGDSRRCAAHADRRETMVPFVCVCNCAQFGEVWVLISVVCAPIAREAREALASSSSRPADDLVTG